jgi:hypothetical protein
MLIQTLKIQIKALIKELYSTENPPKNNKIVEKINYFSKKERKLLLSKSLFIIF